MRLNRGRWYGEVKRLTDLSATEIELWRHLHTTRHELRSPFFSFEFAHAVAKAGARARVCLLYEGGTLAGFFPFQYAGAPAQAMGVGERIGGFLSGFCGTIMDQSWHPRISREDLLRCMGLGRLRLGSSMEKSEQHLNIAAARTLGTQVSLVQEPEQYWPLVRGRRCTTYDNLGEGLREIDGEFPSVEFAFANEEPPHLLEGSGVRGAVPHG